MRTGLDLVVAWRTLVAERPVGGWWWMSQIAHQGDIYAMCTLAQPFKQIYGQRAPMRLVLGEASRVPELFEGVFDEIVFAPELTADADAWTQFRFLTGLPAFGLDVPLLIFPTSNPDTRFAMDFLNQNYVCFLQIFKYILRLEPRTKPSLGYSHSSANQARALCVAQGMPEGSSVVFAPYARSWQADTSSHFAYLAKVLQQRGLTVFTSCAPDELAIEGTMAISVPLPFMPVVAEFAGWFIGIRSGVCDVVSSARCTKTIIFGTRFPIELWGLDKIGFCEDAHQIEFEFQHRSPEDFAMLVTNCDRLGFSTVRPDAAPIRRPSLINEAIGIGGAFGMPAHWEATRSRSPLNIEGLCLTKGWWELEPWGVWGRGNSHTFEISFDELQENRFSLQVAVQPVAPGQVITISVDGVEIGRDETRTGEACVIQAYTFVDHKPSRTLVEVVITTDRGRSPYEVSEGVNDDKRLIGVGLLWVKILVPDSSIVL